MKYILPLAFMGIILCTACGSSKKSSTSNEIIIPTNISQTVEALTTSLAETLVLNNSQQNSVFGTLNTYLTALNDLPETTKSTQIAELKGNALRNMKGMFTAGQYTQLMNLGGKKKSAKSLKNALKGGDGLSDEAVGVLLVLLK